MSQKTKTTVQEPINETLGFSIPDTSSTLSGIKAALREEHKEEENKNPNKTKKKRPSSSICFCEDPSCSIGPFIETQGGDIEQG